MRFLTLRIVALAGLAAILTLFTARPANAQDAAGGLSPEGQALAQAINSVRSQNGLAGLNVNSLLNQAAQNHVDDLIANGMYGHYGSDGSNVRVRVLRTGYPSGLVSENWVTSGTPESAMQWWMNDWIHRVNILDSSWDEVGIGAGRVGNGFWIFVTDFANSDGQDSPAVAVAGASPAAAMQPVETVPAEGMDYTIRGGDTLLAIGYRFGIEWQDIAIANSMGEADILAIGKVIRIPGIASADPSSVAEGGLLYTVSSGDTLSGIATRFEIAWQDIATANRMGEYTILQIGMQLRLPGVEEDAGAPSEESDAEGAETEQADSSGEVTPSTAQSSASRSQNLVITTKLLNPVPGWSGAPARAAGPATGGPVGATHSVQSGDTLFTIAARNGITWQQLAAHNSLAENALIQIGQILTIPPASDSATSQAAGAATAPASAPVVPQTIEVQPGDTVIRIALRHDVDWKALLATNGLSDNSILQPGQELVLP